MKIPIEIGAMSPAISEQLKGSVLTKTQLKLFDRMSNSLTLCYLHGLIPESVYKSGGAKLIKKLQANLDKSTKGPQ